MASDTQSPNQRRSFRCKVVDAGRLCQLIVGADVLSARLLDESAGGFAVAVDRLAGLEVGQTAELRTDTGHFSVRVANVAETTPSEDANAPAEEQHRSFRLGLMRLGEISLPEPPGVSVLAGSLLFRPWQWHPSNGSPTLIGGLLAMAVVIVPLGLIYVFWYAGQSNRAWIPQWGNPPMASSESSHGRWVPAPLRQSADDLPSSKNPAEPPEFEPPFDNVASASGGGQTRGQTTSWSSSFSEQEWYDAIQRLPGADPLTLPEVVEYLQLTADQQERIGRVIEATAKAIRDLDSQLPGQQRKEITEQREQLRAQARREALKILTDEQRARWNKLIGQP